MTRKRFIVLALLLTLLSLNGIRAKSEPAVRATLSNSSGILNEPLILDIRLKVADLSSNAVVIASKSFLVVKVSGPHGPCKKLLVEVGSPKSPWSPWLDAVFLTSDHPEWENPIRLTRRYDLMSVGTYHVQVSWMSQPLDDFGRRVVEREVSRKFPGKTPTFLEKLAFSRTLKFVVKEPTGIDLQAYQATNRCPMCKPSQLLKQYPTSTYAGYALLGLGPGFTMWDLVNLSAENRDQHLAVPQGASKEKQDEFRAKSLEAYQSFLDKAKQFLLLHPDFAQIDLLRKEMANALFLLGRQDEALEQVKLIEAKDGSLAEEAEKTLQKVEKAK